ncbi:MAG: hypothetical protein NC902_05655, partial [Candidatus Omnitrophica bacterium]|nr:hypothetical protein [Candidatus Omnitrophota bacterium]
MNGTLRLKTFLVAVSICWLAGVSPAQTRQNLATSTTEIDLLYSDAIKSYYQKDYSRAISLLKQIQGL